MYCGLFGIRGSFGMMVSGITHIPGAPTDNINTMDNLPHIKNTVFGCFILSLQGPHSPPCSTCILGLSPHFCLLQPICQQHGLVAFLVLPCRRTTLLSWSSHIRSQLGPAIRIPGICASISLSGSGSACSKVAISTADGILTPSFFLSSVVVDAFVLAARVLPFLTPKQPF